MAKCNKGQKTEGIKRKMKNRKVLKRSKRKK